MSKIPYREFHLFSLLEGYSAQNLPLDLFISKYFRSHPSLGSKDRGFIAETVYALIRWQGLLDFYTKIPTWEARYSIFKTIEWENIQNNPEIPDSIRVSFPPQLFDLMVNNFGKEQAQQLCLICNTPAPTTIRTNTLKISREDLLKKLSENFEVTPASQAHQGIHFLKKTNFFNLDEFKKGFFEVQDEGSQLLADLMEINGGEQVLDYCAGSGGKTLAFAAKMQGKGQIYVHDIRTFALQEAKKRLKRAGIQNYQLLLPEGPQLSKLKKKMDWVLVDAPCTGTGTLRRNPDMKWKFSLEMLERLISQQRVIFEKALSFLKPNGRIVYATCSLLKEENQMQIDHFLRTYSLELVGKPFQTLPSTGGMDGFFGAVLRRK